MEKTNKLIAEFMGMTNDVPNDNSMMVRNTPQGNEVIPIDSLQYDSSWDWLMPVVIKIGGSSNILGAMRVLRRHSLVRSIDDTYQAVVEFIKEQNTIVIGSFDENGNLI